MILDAGCPSARRRVRNRLIAMIRLGGKCIGFDRNTGCPWNTNDPRALQFDHVNGLSEEGRIPNDKIYKSIIYGKAPAGYYQLLCANCNWVKRYECHENRPKHGGEEMRQYRLKREQENRDNPWPAHMLGKFKWPRDIHGMTVQSEDLENLLYLIAEERGIDPTTIPDHKYREDCRVRFNRPYGYVRPKSGDVYLSPIEHFAPKTRV
jgi:hypothetical protein